MKGYFKVQPTCRETTQNQIKWVQNYRQKLMQKYEGDKKVRLTVLNDAQMNAWMKKVKPFYDWITEKFDPEMSRYLEDCRKAWRETHDTPPPSVQ